MSFTFCIGVDFHGRPYQARLIGQVGRSLSWWRAVHSASFGNLVAICKMKRKTACSYAVYKCTIRKISGARSVDILRYPQGFTHRRVGGTRHHVQHGESGGAATKNDRSFSSIGLSMSQMFAVLCELDLLSKGFSTSARQLHVVS